MPDTGPQRGIGVITPFDFALDRELWRWVPDDVSLYVTRLPYRATPVTVELALAISQLRLVRRATRDVLTPEPDVVVYACASGSFVRGRRGERRLVAALREAGAPAARTTSGALVEALEALGVRNLAVATPYVPAVTELLVGYLAEHGVRTVSHAGLGLLDHIWRVPYGAVLEIARAVDSPSAEAIFLSCTNLPSYDILEPLERALGKPVLSANQVTMWAALRAMHRRAVGAGQRLLAEPVPA